jgi:DNA-binding winged helix-turn-helix (wHTH) protein/TolB-like protein/tetratricopeptide (TPR) repeat protein
MDVASVPCFVVNGIAADFGDETLRDQTGRRIPLRPQAFAVLRCLAEHPGRLVTKDELMAAVWPGIAVTDDSLVQCIGEVRRAIGDEAHAVVRTVPRRGYRLALPAESAPVQADRPRRSGPLALAAAVLVACVAGAAGWLAFRPEPNAAAIDGPPILAVVPFVDLAGDAASRSLLDAFGKRFYVQDLARFREFLMVVRGPTFVHREQLAGGLAVDYVLGGSVHRDGDRLYLMADLTDARTGATLWSERWDRSEREVSAMRAEVTAQIANRVGGATGVVQELGRAVAERRRPADRTAWELFLLGSGQLALATRAGAEEAAALLGRAVELDPDFAHAAALLALARFSLAEFGIDPETNLAAGLAAAKQAAFLDPEDAWAYAALGTGYRLAGDLVRARSEFETALVLTPNLTEILAYFAGWAATAGQPDRGAAMADRVVLYEPNVPAQAAGPFARAYFMAGRYRSALAMIERVPPDGVTPVLRAIEVGALAAVGRPGDAAAAAAEALEAEPDASIEDLVAGRGWSEAERRRLVETLRLAGFPPCAAGVVPPSRLPECARLAETAP